MSKSVNLFIFGLLFYACGIAFCLYSGLSIWETVGALLLFGAAAKFESAGVRAKS